ncbi:BatD family protein [Ferrimonas balearica]|uniref:BatD family protein n=1 Tax=Ferrimonas balearica TaxID=44012 RepID=UPI001C5A1989|nr:BatD family protein [Ferrimonas balearica]
MVSSPLSRLLFVALLWLGLSPATLALTELQASIDQNPVVAGQSFILEVVADDDVESNALDTSALLRDFAVGQTRVSRSTQIVNFDARRETRWTVMLIARNPGQVTLPALDINGVRSQPIALTVLAPGDAQVQNQTPLVFLETDLAQDTLWLGQPAKATVRLFLGADLQRGALNAPSADNALIRQLGQDRESSQIIKGRRYRIIERDYVIVPQITGTVSLQPANFEGDVLVPSGRRDLFGRAQPKPMAIQGEPIELNVKAQPASYQGHWLAADLVTLNDSLDPSQSFEVGQPISRTLTLTAVGAVEESLAEIPLEVPESLRLYTDKNQRQGGVQNGQLIARLEQTMAIVPSQPGEYTLPEIKVPWWNARLDRQQWATLPAQTITVTGTAASPATPPPVLSDSARPAAEPITQTPNSPGYWPWATALFALLWLATLAWGWQRGRGYRTEPQPAATPTPPSNTLAALHKACEQNQAETALALLPEWASEHSGKTMSLADIGHHYPSLAGPLKELQASRYSVRNAPWQGQALAAELTRLQKQKANQQASPLPPLNPATRMER